MLHILEPEQIVDKAATEKLVAAMTEVISSGALDKLDENGEFHEISYSRMGGYGEEQLAKQLLETPKATGVARDVEDGKSIPMQPMVRSESSEWTIGHSKQVGRGTNRQGPTPTRNTTARDNSSESYPIIYIDTFVVSGV